MKIIKISNGEIHVKDFCTRKLRKEINKVLYKEIKMSSNAEGNSTFDGFTMESLDDANDAAMLGMIEKIIINGEEKPVTMETVDSLDTKDYDLVFDEVNKITSKESPKV